MQAALLSLFITLAMGTEFDLQEMLNEVQDSKKTVSFGEEEFTEEDSGLDINNLIPVHEAAKLEKEALKNILPYDWNEIIGITEATLLVNLLPQQEIGSDISDSNVFGTFDPPLAINEVNKLTRTKSRTSYHPMRTKTEKAQVEATRAAATFVFRPTKPFEAKKDKEVYGDSVLDFIKSAQEVDRRKGDAFDVYVKPMLNGLTLTSVELKNTQLMPMIQAFNQRTLTAPRVDVISKIVASLQGLRMTTKTITLKGNLRKSSKYKFLGTTEFTESDEISYDNFRYSTIQPFAPKGLKDIKSLLKDAGIDSDYGFVTKPQVSKKSNSLEKYDDIVVLNKNYDDGFKRTTNNIEVLKKINSAVHRNILKKPKFRFPPRRKMDDELNQKFDNSNKADDYFHKFPRTGLRQYKPQRFGNHVGRKSDLRMMKPTTLLLDVPGLLNILKNLTNNWSNNALKVLNKSLMRQGVSTHAHHTTEYYFSDTTTSANYEHNDIYYEFSDKFDENSGKTDTDHNESFDNVVMGKCYVCGLEEQGIPGSADCSDQFSSSDSWFQNNPRVPKNLAFTFKKFCRWKNQSNYLYDHSNKRNIFGRWTGGCSVRWIDISGVYTQRSCRNRNAPTRGRHWASARMTRLELALKDKENGCIISPVASLVPLSRAISLYARFHACVCTGDWCNVAVKQQWIAYLAMLPLTFVVFPF